MISTYVVKVMIFQQVLAVARYSLTNKFKKKNISVCRFTPLLMCSLENASYTYTLFNAKRSPFYSFSA